MRASRGRLGYRRLLSQPCLNSISVTASHRYFLNPAKTHAVTSPAVRPSGSKDAPVAFDVDKFWAQVEFNF